MQVSSTQASFSGSGFEVLFHDRQRACRAGLVVEVLKRMRLITYPPEAATWNKDLAYASATSALPVRVAQQCMSFQAQRPQGCAHMLL